MHACPLSTQLGVGRWVASGEHRCSVSQSCTSFLSHKPCVSQGPLSHPQIWSLILAFRSVWGGLLVVLTCIFLMSHDVEHLPPPSSPSPNAYRITFVKCPFRSFSHFLLLGCLGGRSACILAVRPLPDRLWFPFFLSYLVVSVCVFYLRDLAPPPKSCYVIFRGFVFLSFIFRIHIVPGIDIYEWSDVGSRFTVFHIDKQVAHLPPATLPGHLVLRPVTVSVGSVSVLAPTPQFLGNCSLMINAGIGSCGSFCVVLLL